MFVPHCIEASMSELKSVFHRSSHALLSIRHDSTNIEDTHKVFFFFQYRYTWDYIGFYFDLDLPCDYGYFVFKDGERAIDGR